MDGISHQRKGRRISGFTLIELLVVISIIGLLSSIVLTSVNSARSKARNARERSDVKQIITALELARSNSPTDQYPLSAGNGGSWSCLKASGNCWRRNYSALPAQAVSDLAPYLPTLPQTAVNTSGGASCYAYDSYLYTTKATPPSARSHFQARAHFSFGQKRPPERLTRANVPGMTPDRTTADCDIVINTSERTRNHQPCRVDKRENGRIVKSIIQAVSRHM